VSNNTPIDPFINPLSEAARETAHIADLAKDDLAGVAENMTENLTAATKDAAHRASEKAKDLYQTATVKACDTLENSKAYVRKNPVPVVLGALACGAVIGFMIVNARRRPTFAEPLVSVRDAVLAALAPVAHQVHRGYDSARDGVGRAMTRVHRSDSGRHACSLSDQISRVGNNLKFW
jgi:ElaB/YqjD/DUF883 family membrane-anchored ribosome-binding protein